MTDQPSEAALKKACEVLGWNYVGWQTLSAASRSSVVNLARYFDAEDRLAREAITGDAGNISWAIEFTRRHILPDPKPTVVDIIEKAANRSGDMVANIVQDLRDAGLLREEV